MHGSSPQPLYTPSTVTGAFALRFVWTGWFASGRIPPDTSALVRELSPQWELDSLKVLEHRAQDDHLQILFSTLPDVSPRFLATRAKGRLDHIFRKKGTRLPFTRKVAVRSIGENTKAVVEEYISRQVADAGYADPRWEKAMQELVFDDPAVDLSVPQESARGRYWYGLHVVLVTDERLPFSETAVLREIREGCLKIARKKAWRVSRLAVMPDHLHIAVGPPPDVSPLDVVGALQNNLAWMLGQKRIWQDGFYAGTFGDYDMGVVRRRN